MLEDVLAADPGLAVTVLIDPASFFVIVGGAVHRAACLAALFMPRAHAAGEPSGVVTDFLFTWNGRLILTAAPPDRARPGRMQLELPSVVRDTGTSGVFLAGTARLTAR